MLSQARAGGAFELGAWLLVASWQLPACAMADHDATTPPGSQPPAAQPVAEAPEACLPEMPPPTETGRIDVPISIRVGALPVLLRSPVLAPSGREHTVTFFGFYLTRPVLVDASGREAAATLLAGDGTAQPYGVHLVSLSEPANHVLRLAAGPGQYVALKLGVGMPEPCRALDPHDQISPLNSESDMTWAWAGYLHLRLEGSIRESTGAFPQSAIHHFFEDVSYTTVVIPGSISVGQAAVAGELLLDLDRLLDRTQATAPSQHGFDGWLMDNLEQHQALVLK